MQAAVNPASTRASSPAARSPRGAGAPALTPVIVAIALLAAGPSAAAELDAAREALEQRMAACAERTGYDEDAVLDEHALGEGERAWRECVYEGIEQLVMPVSTVPEAYSRLVAEDRVMTDLIERGRITRSDRRTRLDKLVSSLEAEERAAVTGGEAELEGMRDELRASRDEMRRMRDIQSMMAR